MSLDEKLIWKPETPGSEPAGARISAGKSGSVLMSLPKTAAVRVNCVPVSCIPSPESPANRMVTRSSSWMSGPSSGGGRRHAPSGSFMRWCGRGGRLSSSSGNDSARYLMMSYWRTTPTRWPVVVDQRHVAVATGLHQVDRVADRLVEVERVRLGGHQRLDRLAQVDVPADDPSEDVALGQHAGEPTGGVADEDRIAGPGALDRPHAVGQGGARRDGHGLAPAEDTQTLLGQDGHAADDRGLGDFAHGQV